MFPLRRSITAALAAAALTAAALAAGPASAATPPPATLTLAAHITDHGDSGTKGNLWNSENYTLITTVTRVGDAQYDPATYCGTATTDTGHCYKWTATETFTGGTFTTITGQQSPRTGTILGGTASGLFSGWVHGIVFYSSWQGVYAGQARVPGSRNDGGTKGSGDYTVSRWPALFFGPSATVQVADFGDGTVSTYWFHYVLPYGADSQCPAVSSEWTDSVPWTQDGANVTAGDVLVPTQAGNCLLN